MDKLSIISMLVTFVTSNDILTYEPQSPRGQDFVSKWTPPKFCNGNDCPAYTVGVSTKDYEERIYSASNWVSTDLLGIDYKNASTPMFWKLFGYIQGANDKGQKIKMTCPVTTKIIPSQGPFCENNFTMSFFISPRVRQAPQPTDKAVYLRKVDSIHVYVRQFSGFARSFETWSKEAAALGQALKDDGLTYETAFYYTAGYDSPFKLFNRHNEVWFMKK